jgi:hypothetical protein
VGFAAACLSVGEDGAVVAVEDVVDEGKGGLFVDETLCAICAEDVVEGKAFGLLLLVFLDEVDLACLFLDLDDAHTACIESKVPRSVSLPFMGRTRTITFTASAIAITKINRAEFLNQNS